MLRPLAIAVGLFVFMGGFLSAAGPAKKVEPVETWRGKIQDNSLKAKFAPQDDYIADAESWEKLWKAWRPQEEVPKIDFAKNLVLVGTAPGPNLAGMTPQIDVRGNVTFMVFSTRIGGPGFGYTLFQMGRSGVKSVNKHAVPAEGDDAEKESEEGSINVTVVGTLQTGIFAIGGETTGTTITAKGITWELDLSASKEMPKLAEKLNGKQVVVQGSLERRAGVERSERWIVTVKSLQGLR